jgi:DNA-binding transcriptional ArsR family regulator
MRNKTIADVIAEGKLKTFMDHRLIKALGHPVREHILAVLNERIASPKEIGEEIGLEVEDFYHHFEVLEELDCIECVESQPRRGATEHFFRATASLSFDDGEWSRLPETLKSDLSSGMVKPIFDDVIAAIQGRTFDACGDRHVAWLPGYLDEQGLREETTLLNVALVCSIAIRARAARRLAKRGQQGTPWTTALLGFETPDRRDPEGETATPRQAVAPG